MTGRQLRDDAAVDRFLDQLAAAPLAERTARFGRERAGQRHDLADLFAGQPGGTARAGSITEPFLDAQVGQRHALEGQPTLPPGPDRIHVQSDLAGNLGIVVPIGGGKDDLRPAGQLLWRRVPPYQSVEVTAHQVR